MNEAMATALVIKDILLDEEKLLKLAKDCFVEIDEDGSGEIDFNELWGFLSKFVSLFTKTNPTQEDIEEIMVAYASEGKKELNLTDFFYFIKDVLYALMERNISASK